MHLTQSQDNCSPEGWHTRTQATGMPDLSPAHQWANPNLAFNHVRNWLNPSPTHEIHNAQATAIQSRNWVYPPVSQN